MNSAVSAFLSRHNFVRHVDVNVLAESILDDMNRGLRKEKSDEDMITTWCLPPEKAITNKSVIVIDAGGTNFRSCLVTFDENGEAVISDMEKTKMPGVEKELNKKEFFDQFAANLEHLKNKADTIGFCFSYPMTITKDGDGVLINFTKEVKAPEVVGCAIGKCLKESLVAHGWNEPKRVSLLNDTVAALLAGKAAAKSTPYSSYIGFILGTGMNAAYIQPEISELNIEKQIIVCESGKTNAVVMSDFDKAFDAKSQKPGTAFIEKQCSGGYLGPVAYEMLMTAAADGVFSKAFGEKIAKLESMSLIEFNMFLLDTYDATTTLGKIAAECATEEDYDRLYQMLDALTERSARCAAAILTASVIQSAGGTNSAKPVCILCNGSTFWKTKMLFERVNAYLDDVLTVQRGLYWKIVSVDNDITLGTAIAGLIE